MKKVGYLFLILLFPSMLYLILSTGKHGVVTLPYFGIATINNGDSLPYQVAFPLLDLGGTSIDTVLSNKILAINLLNSNCAADCDRSMAQMREFQEKFSNYQDIYTLTICMDDSADWSEFNAQIQDYRKGFDKWLFATSTSASDFVQNQLLLSDSINLQIGINSLIGKVVIIDKSQHIRGYFDVKQYTQYKDLVDAVKVLKAEEFVPRKLKSKPQDERK